MSRARSTPRRLRGKQRDPRRRSEAASSSRDRPPLPTTESGNESDDSTVPHDSDHEDLVIFDDEKLDFTNGWSQVHGQYWLIHSGKRQL